MPMGVWKNRIRKPLVLEHRKKLSESHKGKKFSAETRKRMSKARKGIPHMSGMLGKKHSLATIKKMSETAKKLLMANPERMKNLQQMSGEKSRNWKGGITPIHQKIRNSLEYKIWRTAVFTRDNFTCIWCGDNKGGNLNADHIKPFSLFPELRFAIDNGRTLCVPCHKTTDTYGFKIKNFLKEEPQNEPT